MSEAKTEDKIKVETFVNPDQIQEDLQFTPETLTDAMMRQASLYAHYAVLSARASRQVDRLKTNLDLARAKVDQRVRDRFLEEEKKITEVAVEKEVSRHPTIVAISRAINEARMVEKVINGALEAFKQRRDMLIQIGVTMREEAKGAVYVKEQEAAREDNEARMRERREKVVQNMKERAAA